jgi:hypothetical protein
MTSWASPKCLNFSNPFRQTTRHDILTLLNKRILIYIMRKQ